MYDQPPLSQVNEVFYFSLNKKMNRPCPDALNSSTCRFRHPNHVTKYLASFSVRLPAVDSKEELHLA